MRKGACCWALPRTSLTSGYILVYTYIVVCTCTSDIPIGETDELACWLPAHKSPCAAVCSTEQMALMNHWPSLHVYYYYGFHLFCLARNTIIWSSWLDHVVPILLLYNNQTTIFRSVYSLCIVHTECGVSRMKHLSHLFVIFVWRNRFLLLDEASSHDDGGRTLCVSILDLLLSPSLWGVFVLRDLAWLFCLHVYIRVTYSSARLLITSM